MVLRTSSEQIGFDNSRRTITQEQSLLDGKTLLSQDENLTQVAYSYDRLGRVIAEIAAPDSAQYKATRTFSYALSNGGTGQQATQTTTDSKCVETISYLDGFNRVIKVTRRDADALGGDPTAFRETYSATYNNRGQLISHTNTDWEAAADKPLTTRYEYDGWGEQYRVIGADGVAQVTEIDPATQTLRTWTESTGGPLKKIGKSRTTLNLFGKEDKIETLDTQDKVTSTRRFLYDGLGNCVEQFDEMGESTLFEYDLFGRVQATTLPDYTVLHRTYAAHSGGDLPIALEVVVNNDHINLGTQSFDGLERRTTLEVGKRLQRFEYQGNQVSKMITANKKEITYEYIHGLIGSPVGSVAPDEQSSFNYDFQSAQLTLAQNTQGMRNFNYLSSGHLVSETWKDNTSGKTWETQYSQTLDGRPLSRLDVNGLLCTYAYDTEGRIESLTQGQLVVTLSYDNLSQVSTMTTQNRHSGQTLITTLTYDDQGREVNRLLELANYPAQTISQTFRGDGRLRARELQMDGQNELLETFGYDQRGRMVEYTCEGSAMPQDRYRNAIKEQLFEFDALDNVTGVYTLFSDGRRDDAISYFSPDDPCQLIEVTHTHPDYPDSCTLDYDADGNLIRDENGQTLHYDTQSRLLRVTDKDGQTVSQYRYDAHNNLLGVTQGTQAETLRFYQDDRLNRTEQGDQKVHYLNLGEQPLGQQQQNAPEKTLVLLTDSKNSILGENDQSELRKAVYGAYGERNPDNDLQCLLGFNGEVRDEVSGWYLLGLGYRAYNPTLMRFHSPDSLSPFGAGGINPYMYCAGDPINFVDPTGHANRGVSWMGVLGGVLSAIGIVLTIAAVVVAPPVGAAAILATTATTGIGVGFGGYGIAEGVMATTATKSADRKRHELSSVISGTLDVVWGGIFLGMAIKGAAKAAAKAAEGAAAQGSWHKHLRSSFEKINDQMTAGTKIGSPPSPSPMSQTPAFQGMVSGGGRFKVRPKPVRGRRAPTNSPEVLGSSAPRNQSPVNNQSLGGEDGIAPGGSWVQPDKSGGWEATTEHAVFTSITNKPVRSVEELVEIIRKLKNIPDSPLI
jgi:RHS repeat-associated protein